MNRDPFPYVWYSPKGYPSGRSSGPYRALPGDAPGWRSEYEPRAEYEERYKIGEEA